MSDQEISWGRLVVGAAIAAGAVAAAVVLFPEATAEVGNLALSGVKAVTGEGSWIATKLAELGSWLMDNKMATIATAAGAGVIASYQKQSGEMQIAAYEQNMENEGFRAMEDIKRMEHRLALRQSLITGLQQSFGRS